MNKKPPIIDLLSYDCIYLEDISIEMSIGIYDFEKQKKQRVFVSASLYTPIQRKDEFSIETVVSYETIRDKIKNISGKKHYDLLEEFAEEIAKECFKDKSITAIALDISKPDIFDDVKRAGIKILRIQNNQ